MGVDRWRAWARRPYATEVASLAAIVLAILLFPLFGAKGIVGAPGIVALGLVAGSTLALQAVGLILVYRANRFINFAQVAIGSTAAALFSASIVFRPLQRWLSTFLPTRNHGDTVPATHGLGYTINYFVSLALAFVIAAAIGYGFYFLVVRRFRTAPRLVVSVASIYFVYLLPVLAVGVGRLMATRAQREQALLQSASRGTAATFPFHLTINLSPARLNAGDVLTVVLAVAAIAAVATYLRRSPTGTAIRATSENTARAETLGINVSRVTSRVWLIASALSALVAVLGVASNGASPTALNAPAGVGADGLLLVLAVAVIARFTNLPLALVSALVFGVLREAVIWGWGNRGASLLDGLMVFVLLGFFLVQRYQSSRAERDGAGQWIATRELRPIPRQLRDLATVKRWVRRGAAAVAVLIIGLPWALSPGQTQQAAGAMVFAMVGLSLLVLTGWAGQISLGQFGFCAVGAFVAVRFHLPSEVALPLAAIAGAVTALVVGLPALKLRGLHLAVSTLAFAVFASTVLLGQQYLGKGLPLAFRRPTFVGLDLGNGRYLYYVFLVLLGLVATAVVGLRRSRTARVLIAARDNERSAQALGINLVTARLSAFAVSGAIAALAGALFAYAQGGINLAAFSADQSVIVFLIAVIGGLGSVAGPVLGAAYAGALSIFGAGDTLLRILEGGGGLFLLLLLPGGISKLVYDIRDAMLRRVAKRHHIAVPSLMGERRADGSDERAAITPKVRPGGGTAFVARRYELDDQWGVDLTDTVAAGGTRG